MSAQTDELQSIKDEMIRRGIIPVPQIDNSSPFYITSQYAYNHRNEGAMLFSKSESQNGFDYKGQRYGIDGISYPAGWVDCLRSAGPPANSNIPVWQWTDSPRPSTAGLLPPHDIFSEMSEGGNGGGTVPPDNSDINQQLQEIRDAISYLTTQMQQGFTRTQENDTFNADRIMNRLNQIVEDMENSLQKLLPLLNNICKFDSSRIEVKQFNQPKKK